MSSMVSFNSWSDAAPLALVFALAGYLSNDVLTKFIIRYMFELHCPAFQPVFFYWED